MPCAARTEDIAYLLPRSIKVLRRPQRKGSAFSSGCSCGRYKHTYGFKNNEKATKQKWKRQRHLETKKKKKGSFREEKPEKETESDIWRKEEGSSLTRRAVRNEKTERTQPGQLHFIPEAVKHK